MDLRNDLCPSSADSYVNDTGVELQWAMAATQKAKIHTELLLSTNTSELKLCRNDEQIHQEFRQTFPNLAVTNVRFF